MVVACFLLAKGSRSVINLSLIPWGGRGLARLLTRQFFTAKRTPDSRRNLAFRPLKKKVFPAPTSFRCPSPAKRVSFRATVCTLYLDSS